MLRTIDRGGEGGPGLARDLRLARREIREGRFQRTMALITAFAAVVSGFEAYAQHLRGAFRHWLMWTPVALASPMLVTAATSLFSKRVARLLLPVVSLVSLVDGLVGFVYHLRGIDKLPGGFRLGQYNIVMGPPIFAPLLVGIVGVLGLIASALRREIVPLPERVDGPPNIARTGALPTGPVRRVATALAHGEFQRGMAVTAGSLAALASGEAYFEHLRGSFSQRWMWLPIWASVPVIAAAVGAIWSRRAASDVLPPASATSFLVGALGFLLHLRGLHRMPDGFANLSYNVVAGPPLFAPLLFSAAGLLGVVASLLRRRGGDVR